MFSRNSEKNIDVTESTENSNFDEQSKYNKEKKLDLSYKSCDINNVLKYHNSSIDLLNDHKYYEVIINIINFLLKMEPTMFTFLIKFYFHF